MVTCGGHSSTNIFQLLTLKMCTHIVQAEPYLSDINETNCLDWGVYDRGIEELAASACHDKHGRNRSRNLYSYIHKRKRTLPIQITAVDIPVRIRRPVKVVNKSWPVLHLSSWLKATMEDPKYGGFFSWWENFGQHGWSPSDVFHILDPVRQNPSWFDACIAWNDHSDTYPWGWRQISVQKTCDDSIVSVHYSMVWGKHQEQFSDACLC